MKKQQMSGGPEVMAQTKSTRIFSITIETIANAYFIYYILKTHYIHANTHA